MKDPLKVIKAFARKKGGRCLTTTYPGSKGKVLMECSKGHQWSVIASQIKDQFTWCPYCRGRKRTIKYLQDLAKAHKISCLSKKYRGMGQNYRWECSFGHVFDATANAVKTNKNNCPTCKKDHVVRTLAKIAEGKGGKLLSKKYQKDAFYEFECSEGHLWKASASSIQRGSWCLRCYKRGRSIAKNGQLSMFYLFRKG